MSIEVRGMCPLLQVHDMATSLRFYRDGLGFEVIDASSPRDDTDWAWLHLGDALLMLNSAHEAQHRPDTPDPARQAAHADTELYFACADVDAVYQHCLSQGMQPERPFATSYGMRQVNLDDPDGYRLCFQQQPT